MQFKEYDRVLLKDGREGNIIAGIPDGPYLVDVGRTQETWDSIFVEGHQINNKVEQV